MQTRTIVPRKTPHRFRPGTAEPASPLGEGEEPARLQDQSSLRKGLERMREKAESLLLGDAGVEGGGWWAYAFWPPEPGLGLPVPSVRFDVL